MPPTVAMFLQSCIQAFPLICLVSIYAVYMQYIYFLLFIDPSLFLNIADLKCISCALVSASLT